MADFHLSQADALARLETLAGLVQGSGASELQALTSNVQLTPLSVVLYMIEWLSISLSEATLAQGFCIGFLSAAVAATATQRDFEHYTENAIRLAACIGLVIDEEGASNATLTEQLLFLYAAGLIRTGLSLRAR